jgi:hypothetical protein
MARNRKVTLPEIMEAATDSPAAALGILRKHLKSAIGERYESRTNYLNAILDRNTKNLEQIARAEDTQWKTANRALILYIAIVAAVQLTRTLMTGYVSKAVLGTAAAIGILLVFLAALRMLRTVQSDLALYQETGRLNEEMLNMTVGINALASRVISSRREALSGKHELMHRAGESRSIVVRWTQRMTAGCAVAACAVCELLIWITPAT